jgi:hypothetical protein
VDGRRNVRGPSRNRRVYLGLSEYYPKIAAEWALEGIAGQEEFREVLENAPAGVLDAKSWTYWNLKCGRIPVPLLPARQWR